MDCYREHAHLIINRLDKYISDANVKGNFILAINTLLCGGIFSNYNNIKAGIKTQKMYFWYDLDLVLLLICSVIMTGLILRAVYPLLTSGNSSKDSYHSKIFFNSIATFSSQDEYLTKYLMQSETELIEDLVKQIYQVSNILKCKYKYLKYSMWTVYLELAFIMLLIIIVRF